MQIEDADLHLLNSSDKVYVGSSQFLHSEYLNLYKLQKIG